MSAEESTPGVKKLLEVHCAINGQEAESILQEMGQESIATATLASIR